MKLLEQKNFKIYALDNLLKEKTNLYNADGTINENCKRTEIGQLHFDLKVNKKRENITLISNNIINYLKKLNDCYDIIIPVPSKSNDNVKLVCLDMSKKLNLPVLDIIKYINDEYIILDEKELKNKNVLLIDDSYKTGQTLKDIYNKIKHLSNSIIAITFVKV